MKNRKIIKTLAVTLLCAIGLNGCGRANNVMPQMPGFPGQPGAFPGQPGMQMPGGQFQNPQTVGDTSLPPDATQEQLGSIVSSVLSQDGRPLHNVEIYLEENPSIKTRSNKGDFMLLNVPAGNHNLVLKVGEAETTVPVNVVPNMAVAPEQHPVRMDGRKAGDAAINYANPNKQLGSFKVDQDLFNQWQARGVTASGGQIYIAAVDISRVFRKGTVLRMDAGGSSWKNISKKFLGLYHPMKSTIQGITKGNSVLVVDEKNAFYIVDPESGKVQKVKADGALDVAAGGGQVYLYSTRGIERTDESGNARTAINGITPTGGVGADKDGNGYAIQDDKIMKIDTKGDVKTIVSAHLDRPTDVAIDNRHGDIYVLDVGRIKRFTKDGEFVVGFESGAEEPTAIDLDEEGNLYISDFGTNHRNSRIIKFEPATQAATLPTSDDSSADASADESADTLEDETMDEFEEGGDDLEAGDEGLEELPEL